MDAFLEEVNLYYRQQQEKLQAIEKALDNLPNPPYRFVLEGIYCWQLSPQLLAEKWASLCLISITYIAVHLRY